MIINIIIYKNLAKPELFCYADDGYANTRTEITNIEVKKSKIKAIEAQVSQVSVYCMATSRGNFLANGIIVSNCDALRYACYSAFPQGNFGHPDENLTIEQIT